jgi:hypothetical protein
VQKTYRIDHKPRSTRAPKTPIQLEEWHAWFDKDGKLLLNEREARRRIFQRVRPFLLALLSSLSPYPSVEFRSPHFAQGLADDDVRKQVWPFLLKVYPWDSTGEQRRHIAEEKRFVAVVPYVSSATRIETDEKLWQPHSTEYERVKRCWMQDEELQRTERFQEEDHRVGSSSSSPFSFTSSR